MKVFSAASLILIVALSVAGQVKRPELRKVKVSFAVSTQAVVVTTKGWDSFQGIGRLYQRKNARADWKQVGESFPVVVGRSGLAWGDVLTSDPGMTKIKQEGDGNAPAGMFPLTSAFGTSTKPEGLELPYTKLNQFTECVDDSRSSFYNRIVNRMQVGNFDWKSSEKMLVVGEQYSLGVFVAYNTYPVEPLRGSCIFLHIWKDPSTGTSGCTAMERRNLERIAAWLSPKNNPYLVQMPEDVYDTRRKSWKLPKLN
ncbi:MAG: L,D-transpeptidase [Pyrinomonadaceae bacterium]